jgi:hypothetical protein
MGSSSNSRLFRKSDIYMQTTEAQSWTVATASKRSVVKKYEEEKQ